MNKILYLSINSSYSHSSLAYGQLRASSERETSTWEWSIIEKTINDKSNEILAELIDINPDIIVSTAYLFNRNYLFELLSKFSALLPKTTIVLGGPEFLGNNESILRLNKNINAVFRGDETSFPKYLDLISYNKVIDKELKNISGLCFIDSCDIYFDGGFSLFENDLDLLPSTFELGYFNKKKPFLQIETVRGCSSKCSFCTSSLTKKLQFYSIERIRSDLNCISESGIKEIRVLDRTFNIPSDRAVNLLKLFIHEFPEMKFHLEFNPAKLTDDVYKVLQTAQKDQFHIEVGIQTLDSQTIHAINRKSSTKNTIDGLLALTSLKNIEIHADLIYGLPEQTIDSVYDDINTLIRLQPEEIQIEVLKILPGTPISQSADNGLKFSSYPPYDVLQTSLMNITDINRFSVLSKIIDAYYNITIFSKIFYYAVRKHVNFIKDFLHFCQERFTTAEKPSISVRFDLLFNFATQIDDSVLYDLILFSYFTAGFFNSPKNNVRVVKKNELNEILDRNPPTVWKNTDNFIYKPAFIVEFEFNVCDMWINTQSKIEQKKNIYLLLLSQGGMSKKISRIIKLHE